MGRGANSVLIERRSAYRDGTRQVTAARFRPDGSCTGAWRGPPAGVGRPLRVVARTRDPEEAKRIADEASRPDGFSTEDAEVKEDRGRELVETPAGPIACYRRRWTVSLLFVSMSMAMWHSERPLPLTSLVRLADDGPGFRHEMLVAGYGDKSAAPTLRLPPVGPG